MHFFPNIKAEFKFNKKSLKYIQKLIYIQVYERIICQNSNPEKMYKNQNTYKFLTISIINFRKKMKISSKFEIGT